MKKGRLLWQWQNQGCQVEMAALAEEEASGPSDEMLVASPSAGWSSSDWKCPSTPPLCSAFAWVFQNGAVSV